MLDDNVEMQNERVIKSANELYEYYKGRKEYFEKKQMVLPTYISCQKWVRMSSYVLEALNFFEHLKNHDEVKNAKINPNLPMCKICNKSSREINSDSNKGLSELYSINKTFNFGDKVTHRNYGEGVVINVLYEFKNSKKTHLNYKYVVAFRSLNIVKRSCYRFILGWGHNDVLTNLKLIKAGDINGN